MYGDSLSKILGGGGGPGIGAPPQAAMHGVGLGVPPNMPGMPPPPTGVGAMPTGSGSNSDKMAADTAILSMRELGSKIPALKPQLDALVDQIKAATSSPPPSAPPTAPSLPGAPKPDTSSLDDSGGPGAM